MGGAIRSKEQQKQAEAEDRAGQVLPFWRIPDGAQ
jgi:hypothetical protein